MARSPHNSDHPSLSLRRDVYIQHPGEKPHSYRLDCSKAKKELSRFRPEWNLEKGCEELSEWFQQGMLRGHAFKSRMFVRLKKVQYLMKHELADDDVQPVRNPDTRRNKFESNPCSAEATGSALVVRPDCKEKRLNHDSS